MSPPSLDRLIHEPARLVLVATLYVLDGADFLFLRRRTGMTAGNLSSHMSKLEDGGLVRSTRTFVGKRPNTSFELTEEGRTAFEQYRATMTALLEATLLPAI